MLSQVNASQISRQKIGNAHNGFQSLASITIERFYYTVINLTVILGKRVKKNVKKRQYKRKQTNNNPVFKETIKVEDTKKDSVESKPKIH